MKLILNGGGIGKAVASTRKLLNDLIDHNRKILYIPFAWPDPTYSGCLEFMTDELSDVDKSGIDMVKTPEELTDKDFTEYACLYIGGGNTYKLLNCLKTSGAFEKIRRYLLEDDGIVYGGSAGAIIFGRDLDSCNTDDDNAVGLADNTGFNMINGYSLLCHYTSRGPERTELSRKYLLELSNAKPVIAIPEEDTVYVDDDNITVFGTGKYSVFINGTEKVNKPEQNKTWREKWLDAYKKASFYRSDKNSSAYWDSIARVDGGSLSGDEHIRLIRDHLLDAKLLDAESSLLDIGCGGGEYVTAFAGSCGSITALDYARNMIDTCRSHCEDKGIHNVSYIHADFMDHQFTQKYDAVLACLNPSAYNPDAFDIMLSLAVRVLVYFSMDTDVENAEKEAVYCGCNSVRYAEEYLKGLGLSYRKIPYEYSIRTENGETRRIPFAYLVIVK